MALSERPIPNGVHTIHRVFELLEVMADCGHSVGLTDLARRADLPVPSIHRLIRTLIERGYVRQLPNRRYALTPRLISLGETAARQVGPWSRTHLTRLVERTGETANLAILNGDMATYIGRVASSHSMRTSADVGHSVALHCTGLGKALLVQLPDETVRAMMRRTGLPARTAASIGDINTLIEDLQLCRERGYATDEGEQEVGVRCFSVPVRNARVTTAISVSGPSARVTSDAAGLIVPLLQQAARNLTAQFNVDRA